MHVGGWGGSTWVDEVNRVDAACGGHGHRVCKGAHRHPHDWPANTRHTQLTGSRKEVTGAQPLVKTMGSSTASRPRPALNTASCLHLESGTAKLTGPAEALRRSHTMSRPSPAVLSSWLSLICWMPAGRQTRRSRQPSTKVVVSGIHNQQPQARCPASVSCRTTSVPGTCSKQAACPPVMRPCCEKTALGFAGFSRML